MADCWKYIFVTELNPSKPAKRSQLIMEGIEGDLSY